ncbi:MAG TPA: hypothetical protein VN112_13735 [Ensifer sp.]|nr:hypothetical protein [Ensifer sp.]
MTTPRRNRVTPFGRLEAVPARGQLMGNRGDLHDSTGVISREWKVKRWIACALVHPSGSRAVFDTSGRYTPLFFADEPTALAAGHRPCAECRRADYNVWREGWRMAFGSSASANDLDAALHQARIDRNGCKITTQARLADLPDGVIVTLENAPESPLLLWERETFAWTHEGYGAPLQLAATTACRVLTPAPSVAVLSALNSRGVAFWPGFAAPRLGS